MEQAIDTNVNVSKAIACLKQSGVRTIIRYYNRDQTPKVIKAPEANAILAAGLSLCIVHQRNGRSPGEYSKGTGTLDAAHCRQYGQGIGQPSGSGIYFGVDFDILQNDLVNRVVPYFEAVRAEMAKTSELPSYRVGVYGSGLTCRTLLDRGLVDFTWLSQSRKFQGTPEFRASNRWNILQLMNEMLCGIGVDPDMINPAKPDFGQFGAGARPAGPDPAGPRLRATARDGLRLRSGPGTGFDQIGSLAFGKIVFEVRREGVWSFIDIAGDGRIDGVANNGFLEPV